MKTDCHDCCHPELTDSQACGCCEGVEPVTPLPTANRPGLSQLSYRIGSHASFLETMIARLSNSDHPELAGLTTRNADDSSIAFLDGWATVADVLTFYQERIANEGYLRTATERRSVLELARLVGYKLRPGVSSSLFLAYTIDENTQGETTIPAGSRAQSIPGPDELPQSFETSEDLKARAKWNNLKPRMTQPQTKKSIEEGTSNSEIEGSRVYLKGINTNLKPNDPLLVQFGTGIQTPYRIQEVKPDALANHTLVMLQAWGSPASIPAVAGSVSALNPMKAEYDDIQLIKDLTKSPSLQPPSSTRLTRRLKDQFKSKSELGYTSASTFTPMLSNVLTTAAANADVVEQSGIKVYAMQIKAAPFGHNLTLPVNGTCISEKGGTVSPVPIPLSSAAVVANTETMDIMALDAEYNEIQIGAWVIVERNGVATTLRVKNLQAMTLGGVQNDELSFFSTCPPMTTTNDSLSIGEPLKIRSTVLELSNDWREKEDANVILRNTTLYAQSEELELAEEPIEEPVCGGADESELLELDGFYEGLESGRWVVVSGERDITGTSGVRFSELAMLASVTQDVQKEAPDTAYPDKKEPRLGEKNHTFIQFAEKLSYCFKRDTVTIHGNVVKATHGESRKEILGSGDGSKALQSFDLKQFPLTHVSASNPTGIDSTLSVFVNDVEWRETDSLTGLHATDRLFVTRTDDDAKTSVMFGNGKQGTRLPTGIENIRAEYRNGIGKGGNVKAEQVSLLATKPLGVKEVINPLRASGGADRENRDQARKSAPLAVMALDRLVSVQDYQDFSRLYAGIGKSDAVEISDGRRQRVHVTIAGADDIPIDETSDLFINLRQALHDFGDPYQPIQLAIRELKFIVISANIRIQPDYQWESVVINLRVALLDAFSFERRELGQDVVLSEVISVMQAVPGITYVDVDAFGGIPEKIAENDERRLLTPDEISEAVACLTTEWRHDDMDSFYANKTAYHYEDKCKKYGNMGKQNRVNQRLPVNLADYEQDVIRPAQLAFLTPDVPDTLILNQIK